MKCLNHKIKAILVAFLLLLTHEPIQAQLVNFQWAKHLGGVWKESCTSIAANAAGNVYTVGTFINVADFDPGPGKEPSYQKGTVTLIL